MIKKLIHTLSYHHHPWRRMQFDELAEIYTSMTMRSFGFSVIGIFVPVYFYQNGVSIQDIMLFYGVFFLTRIPFSFLAGRVVGRIGPKHTIAVSTVLITSFFGMLLSYDAFAWPLWSLMIMYSIANSLFFIALNTDFSSAKDKKHGGKELGWLLIFEQLGAALGPVIGGLLAGLVAPEVAIVFAMTVLLASLIPLFMSGEVIKVHQKVNYKKFPIRKYARGYLSLGVFQVQNASNKIIWPLLLAVFIFTEGSFEKIGALVGLSMGIAIFSARMYGKFIDTRRGLSLLRYGVAMTTVMLVIRSSITSAGGAVAIGALGEPITLAYRMPLVKSMYEESDGSENHRIVYHVIAEVVAGFVKSMLFLVMFACMFWFDPISVLRGCYVVIAVLTPLTLIQNFKALKKG